MNEFYGGGGVESRHAGLASRARASNGSVSVQHLKGRDNSRSSALPASTLSPTSPAYSPRLVPAVTGQGTDTDESAMREAYWREQMADAAPTTDRHFNEYGWA